MHKFCRIIDTPKTQVLLVKADALTVEVHAMIQNRLMVMPLEFSDKANRDKGFDRMSKRYAKSLIETIETGAVQQPTEENDNA